MKKIIITLSIFITTTIVLGAKTPYAFAEDSTAITSIADSTLQPAKKIVEIGLGNDKNGKGKKDQQISDTPSNQPDEAVQVKALEMQLPFELPADFTQPSTPAVSAQASPKEEVSNKPAKQVIKETKPVVHTLKTEPTTNSKEIAMNITVPKPLQNIVQNVQEFPNELWRQVSNPYDYNASNAFSPAATRYLLVAGLLLALLGFVLLRIGDLKSQPTPRQLGGSLKQTYLYR